MKHIFFENIAQSQVTLSDFISYKKQSKPIVPIVRQILRTKNPRVMKTKQNRLMFLSNFAVCVKKKLTFIKNQELLNKNCYLNNCLNKIIVNKFLLTEDKFMAESHLRQPGFTYSTCEPFTKHC